MTILSMSPTGSYQFYLNIRYGMWHAARGGGIVPAMILSMSPTGLDRLWVTARLPAHSLVMAPRRGRGARRAGPGRGAAAKRAAAMQVAPPMRAARLAPLPAPRRAPM